MNTKNSLLIATVTALLPFSTLASFSVNDLPELTGEITGDQAGSAVATGDINGDGYDDLLVGAKGYREDGGAVYLFYGGEDLITSTSLSTADAIFNGIDAQRVGSALTTGDVNADGYDDIVIGATNYSDNGSTVGAVYVLYGQSDPLVSLQLNSKNSTQIIGQLPSLGFGDAVGVVDLNGDNADELMIGATAYGDTDYGATYLIYGTSGEEIADETISATTITITGVNTYDMLGSSVAGIGDLNQDGFEDAAIGAPRSEEGRSRVWILYGQTTVFTSDSVNNLGIRFNNEVDDDQVGSVGYVGDVNNDGYDDLVSGAPQHDPNGLDSAGAAYLISGQSTNYTNGTFGTTTHFYGVEAGEQVGVAMAGGDTNGDGYNDIMIGAQPSGHVGHAYLVYGDNDLISMNLSGQESFEGEEVNDRLGSTVAMGDLNNDGYSEIVLGATGRLSITGSVYIVYSTVDTDGDGIPGTDGVLFDGEDTNDNDFDNDGITDDLDTNADTSYEIPDDGYDNDGDGTVDETTNTVEENGTHTGYDLLNPDDPDTAATTLTNMRGRKNGKIKVTYSDGTAYVYTIFNKTSTRKTKVQQYDGLGYYVVTQSNGKKVALVNAYTGEVYHRKTISQRAYRYTGLLLGDVRTDDVVEAVVTNRKKARVQTVLVKVNTTTRKLNKRSQIQLLNKKVHVSKTKINGNKITLRNSRRHRLERLKTNQRYKLSVSN